MDIKNKSYLWGKSIPNSEDFLKEYHRIGNELDYMENREPSDIREIWLKEEDYYNRLLSYYDILSNLITKVLTIVSDSTNPNTIDLVTQGFLYGWDTGFDDAENLDQLKKTLPLLLDEMFYYIPSVISPGTMRAETRTPVLEACMVLHYFVHSNLYDLALDKETQPACLEVSRAWDKPSFRIPLKYNFTKNKTMTALLEEVEACLEALK